MQEKKKTEKYPDEEAEAICKIQTSGNVVVERFKCKRESEKENKQTNKQTKRERERERERDKWDLDMCQLTYRLS